MISDPVAERVRAAAFRRLVRTSKRVSATQLADDLEYTESAVQNAIDDLHRQGQLRLDADGRIIGSAGLSIQPDRHDINLDGRSFWTWCAYDVFGIFAALAANGHARTVTPDTGQPVKLDFRNGQPQPASFVLFLPEDDPASCDNAYEQWCPHSNLFHTAEAATAWATDHGLTGQVLTLTEAAERGGARWAALT